MEMNADGESSSSTTAETDERAPEPLKRLIQRYHRQLTRGCRRKACENSHCASSPSFEFAELTREQLVSRAVALAKARAPLCPRVCPLLSSSPPRDAVDMPTSSTASELEEAVKKEQLCSQTPIKSFMTNSDALKDGQIEGVDSIDAEWFLDYFNQVDSDEWKMSVILKVFTDPFTVAKCFHKRSEPVPKTKRKHESRAKQLADQSVATLDSALCDVDCRQVKDVFEAIAEAGQKTACIKALFTLASKVLKYSVCSEVRDKHQRHRVLSFTESTSSRHDVDDDEADTQRCPVRKVRDISHFLSPEPSDQRELSLRQTVHAIVIMLRCPLLTSSVAITLCDETDPAFNIEPHIWLAALCGNLSVECQGKLALTLARFEAGWLRKHLQEAYGAMSGEILRGVVDSGGLVFTPYSGRNEDLCQLVSVIYFASCISAWFDYRDENLLDDMSLLAGDPKFYASPDDILTTTKDVPVRNKEQVSRWEVEESDDPTRVDLSMVEARDMAARFLGGDGASFGDNSNPRSSQPPGKTPMDDLYKYLISTEELKAVWPRQRSSKGGDGSSLSHVISFHDQWLHQPGGLQWSDFVHELLNEVLPMEKDFVKLLSLRGDDHGDNDDDDATGMKSKSQPSRDFAYLRYPFILNTANKTTAMLYDLKLVQTRARRVQLFTSLMDVSLNGSRSAPLHDQMFFKLRIRRDHIVEDAVATLETTCLTEPDAFMRRMYVEFENEAGVDDGGLAKEFFQLLIAKLFDPDYGLFVMDERTRLHWFNPRCADVKDLHLVGLLVGLALYNNIMLDVSLPPVLFKKLCRGSGTLNDLASSHPTIHQSLMDLKSNTDKQDFDSMGLTFEARVSDNYGGEIVHELAPNGSQLPVSSENVDDFARLYADALLNVMVEDQFSSFSEGFRRVLGGSTLASWLLRPAELELCICGLPNYDLSGLRAATVYDGYTDDAETIVHFWEVFEQMSTEERRLLLTFTTGSDRVPVGGLAKLSFGIFRAGPDSEQLPTAHTCYNALLLPDYMNKEKLAAKLAVSLKHCHGFGLR